ncbi:MAG: ABC transporter permease [Dehalococcoidia bacterium]|nr:ABC transporter permease [Dehalococcoidia bacterium]
MTAYIVRRLLLIIPALFVVTLIVFLLVRLLPGDVIELMVSSQEFGSKDALPLTIDSLKHQLGLDVPVYVQYGRWLTNIALHGSLGKSLWMGTPVADDIAAGLPITFELGLLAILTSLLIAVPIGVYSAIRQDTLGDYLGRSFAIFCIAVPSFWLGTMVIVFPSIWWHWTPPLQYVAFGDNPLKNLANFIIPGVILGMVISGTTMRMTRTMMLEVLRQDYIRTAWAKGLAERTIVIRHAAKNALIPIITVVGLQLPLLVGGSVIIEQIFNLPGIGRLLLQAIQSRDYTLVSGINLVIASFVLLANFMVDLTYGFLDPRIKTR